MKLSELIVAAAVAVGASLAAMATSASAADLAARPVYKSQPPVIAPVFNWTGCYVGGNVGAAWNHSDFATTVDPGTQFSTPTNLAKLSAAGTGSAHDTGFIGGGQAGCNWQTGSLVIGLEGDINALSTNAVVTGNAATSPGPAAVTNSLKTSWMATARPRVGVAFDRSLFYVTGGVAFTNVKYTQTYSDPLFPAFGTSAVSQTKTGWTFGAGYEYAFNDNWSVKTEYLYARFGSIGNDWLMVFPTATSNMMHGSAKLNINIARLGLNYKF